MTPEGRVKQKLKQLLRRRPDLDQRWPVLRGMGSPMLDCHVCYRGRYIAIECKAPGEVPTPRQRDTAESLERAGAIVFVFRGTDQDCADAEAILDLVEAGRDAEAAERARRAAALGGRRDG